MTGKIDRRNVMISGATFAAATVAGCAAGIIGDTDPDAELLRLEREYDAALLELKAANANWDIAYDVYEAHMAAGGIDASAPANLLPDITDIRRKDMFTWQSRGFTAADGRRRMELSQIEEILERDDDRRALAKAGNVTAKLTTLWNDDRATLERLRDQAIANRELQDEANRISGCPEAETRVDTALDRVNETALAIGNATVHTMAGLRIKARVVMEQHYDTFPTDDPDMEPGTLDGLGYQFARQVLALAEGGA